MPEPDSAWPRFRVLRGPFKDCVAELVDFGADDSSVVVEMTVARHTTRVELARADLASEPHA